MKSLLSSIWKSSDVDNNNNNSSTSGSLLLTSLVVAATAAAAAGGSYLAYNQYKKRALLKEKRRNGPFTITEINIYPVKSLRGMTVKEWPIGKRGFLFDRQWMVVTENVAKTNTNAEYQFVTQRQLPRMCLVGTMVHIEEQTLTLFKVEDEKDKFVLDFSKVANNNNNKRVTAELWKKTYEALDMGDEVAQWLSQTCKKDGLRLVMVPDDLDRKPSEKYYSELVKEKGNSSLEPMLQTGFSDEYPYLITTENSLDDVNTRLEKKVTMRRFRPNIVIGRNNILKPFEEEYWKHIQVTSSDETTEKDNSSVVDFYNVQLCVRCSIPNIDPETARREETGPSYQLTQYHKTPESGPLFGINLMHSVNSLNKIVRVGDVVSILSRHDTPPM